MYGEFGVAFDFRRRKTRLDREENRPLSQLRENQLAVSFGCALRSVFDPTFFFTDFYKSVTEKERRFVIEWGTVECFFLFWYFGTGRTTIYYVIKDYRVTDIDRD